MLPPPPDTAALPGATQRNRSSSSHVQSPQLARPPMRPRHSSVSGPSSNLFIKYIPPEFTEADLRALCAEFGAIVSTKVMINLQTGCSKGFGFVRFATLEEAQAALLGLDGRRIENKRLLVRFAESRERQDRASTMLYVKRLPLAVDQGRVIDVFARYGEITAVWPHVIESADPQFWRCVVEYSTLEEAAAALAGMNNQIMVAGSNPIHVRYAERARMEGNLQQLIPFHSPQLLPSFLLA
jgi:RNA recognition motif-containing protein